jgi:hypothetical protein
MFLATANKSKQLLHMSYIQRVEPGELRAGRADVEALLSELPRGCRVLADFGRLETMSPDCGAEIGLGMEQLDRHGVGLIVRVIPDPSKDIGLNILTVFHYKQRPRIVTCETLSEAARALEL